MHTHPYTAIDWRSVVLQEKEFGSPRLLRLHREVPHQFTLQWISRISITFVVEFIARVAFPTFYGSCL